MWQLTIHVHVLWTNLFHDIRHVSYVSCDNERRPHYAPHAELCAVFSVRLTRTVFQWFVINAALPTCVDEVSIIPSTRTWEGGEEERRKKKSREREG